MFNLNSSWGIQNVEELIASKDDSITRQIVVDENGDVYIHDGIFKGPCHTRFESFQAGNGYLGLKASQDTEWVGRIEDALRKNWPVATSTYLDWF